MKDSVFNFDYIIKAFNSGPPKPVKSNDMDMNHLDRMTLVIKNILLVMMICEIHCVVHFVVSEV